MTLAKAEAVFWQRQHTPRLNGHLRFALTLYLVLALPFLLLFLGLLLLLLLCFLICRKVAIFLRGV